MENKTIHDELEARLADMQGKPFMFHTVVQRVTDWSYQDDEIIVTTDHRKIKKLCREMLILLKNDFLPVEEKPTDLSKRPETLEELIKAPKLSSFDACDNFMEALKRAMEKVETTPEFKPQADSMANIAKQAIDYAKVQIDAIKTVNDIVRNR